MEDLSKIETRISPISTMTDSERTEFFANHIEQVSNCLLIIDYLERTKYTKVWHEQVDYLMKNFTIKNKI